MAERQRQVASIILKDPAVESLTSFVGVDGTNPALNRRPSADQPPPLDERDDRVQTVISRLQQAVDGVPGVALYLQPTQDLTIDTCGEPHPVPVHPAGKLPRGALSTRVPPLLSRLGGPAAAGPTSAATGRTKAWPPISRWIATAPAALGISMADVDNALYNAFGQRLISTIYTQANQYRVVLEQDTEATPGLAALENIRLTSSDGGIVPLTAIATVEQRFTPLSVNHLDQFPVTTISFNVPDNYSLGEAVEAIPRRRTVAGFPDRYSHPVPGQLVGLPVGARQHRLAGGRRGGGDVYRAGGAVRELYPSDYDSLHPAHRRGRGAAGAVAGGQRAGRDPPSSASFCWIGIVKKNAISDDRLRAGR